MKRKVTATTIAQATGKTRQAVTKRLSKIGACYLWEKGPAGNEKHYFSAFLPQDYRVALAAEDTAPVLGNPTDLAGAIGSAAAKEILSKRAAEKELVQIAKEEGLAAFEQLPESRKLEAQARYSFLLMCNGFVASAGFSIKRYARRSKVGDKAFVEAYNNGKIRTDEAILRVIGTKTSYSTLKRIADAYYRKGVAGLAFGYHNPRRGCTVLSDDQQDLVIAMMCKNPNTSNKNLQRALQGRYGMDVPSTGVIKRFRNRWIKDNADLWLFYTNPDAWNGAKMFAFGSASISVERLNQLWEADSTPADLMLSDGRHSIIGMIDVYSRRLRFVVSKTSKSSAVVALTRHCLIEWGVPEILKTDNGKDYVSEHVVRVLHELGIEQRLCTPFQGWEKPHIERAFRSFLHGLVELMPGFIGHNVSERKAIESRKSFADRVMNKDSEAVEVNMSSTELQRFCNEWCNFIYERDKHDGLGGKRPIDMVRQWKQPVRRISNIRALDMLLMPAPKAGGMRTITKKGVVVDGRHYQHPDYAGHVGEKVFVLLDPADLGTAYIYLQNDHGEREFLCPGIDPVWSGIDPTTFSVLAKKHQAKHMRAGRRELKKISKDQGNNDAYSDYLSLRRSQAMNIIELPQRAESYRTRGLDEGAKAVDAIQQLQAGEDAADSLELDFDQVELAPVQEKSPREKVVLLMSDSERYVQIRDRIKETGRKLNEMEFDWLGVYYRTSSGQMYKSLEGDLRKKIGLADAQEGAL
jgi:putative transposase